MFHPQGPTFWELARQALSSTKRGYDLLAPKFDYTPFRTPDELLDAIAPLLGEPRSIDSALDVCCGTGAGMQMIRPLCRDRVVGFDFSQNMMDVARERLGYTDGARLEFVQGEVMEMDFHEEFDVALCFGALGHIPRKDEARFVERIHRALKPGGRFVFASGYLPSRLSAAYWLSRGFNAAMHVRNVLVRPPFIMFYLTFLIPEATRHLEDAGFNVDIHRDVFPKPFERACLVIATKRA